MYVNRENSDKSHISHTTVVDKYISKTGGSTDENK